MTPSLFRLFQLPQVTLRELLNLFDLNELFILSLCSRRSRRYVKVYYNRFLKQKIEVMGWISGPSIQFKGVDGTISTITIKESTELEYTEKVTIGGHTVPFVITTKTSPVRTLQSCELVWYDERIGLKIVADYICELFSSVPSELSIAPSFLWMLEMFNDISQMVLISPIPSKGPYFGWVPLNEKENLEVLKAKIRCPFLWLGGDYPDNFSYTGSFEVHDEFRLDDGKWITFDNLVSIGETCTDVTIRKSKLNCKDINSFLKIWMNHKMNALRLLVIECGNIDQDVLFDGLEEEMITVEGTMVYENKNLSAVFGKHHRSLGFPSGQKVLRRNDGMIAAAARHVIGLCIGIWTDIDSIRENEKGDYQMPPIMNPLDPFM